ncbi:hypothetical protein Dimus_006668 [Dionaea muscipula]
MAEAIGRRIYSCVTCRNHVALHDDIVSKSFHAQGGRAFLFSHVVNVVVGCEEERNLMTGVHTVADASCCGCKEVVGWKYIKAFDESQKYKEGKFVLERYKIVEEKEDSW